MKTCTTWLVNLLTGKEWTAHLKDSPAGYPEAMTVEPAHSLLSCFMNTSFPIWNSYNGFYFVPPNSGRRMLILSFTLLKKNALGLLQSHTVWKTLHENPIPTVYLVGTCACDFKIFNYLRISYNVFWLFYLHAFLYGGIRSWTISAFQVLLPSCQTRHTVLALSTCPQM